MKKKILIIGCQGHIGFSLSYFLKDRYEIIVYKKLNPYNYLYSFGKATASKVVEVAEKYNIEL